MPFIALVLGIPLGILVERFAKHRVLQIAFGGIIVACVIGFHVTTPLGLAIAALFFGLGDMTLEVTHKAFLSDHYPPEKIGQLTGCVNIFYATGRTSALILMGFAIRWYNHGAPADLPLDYRVIWIVSGLAALLGIGILSAVRDRRFEERNSLRASVN